MSQPELLKRVVDVLDSAGAAYMLTGSYASSLQGQPRSTHDIDLVVAITSVAVQSLLEAFPTPDYFLDETSINAAIGARGQFNLIDIAAGDKVDFWLLTDDAFDQSRFARRYEQMFRGRRIYVSRPEDTILMKLRWCEMSGGSEKQFADALSVYEVQVAVLDLPYMEHWAHALELDVLWERIQREARRGI